jgi:hypothetical protein
MKICILGLGKTGTTALLFKVAGGLPNCATFSGGKPGRDVGAYENAVYKHTYSERKGKTFELYREHFARERYDRYIWTARDPRDAAISRMLYRWHLGYRGSEDQYRAHVAVVLEKERDPRAVSFAECCRYAGHERWPLSLEEVIEKERVRYARMTDFVRGLGEEWHVFKYEDLVDGRFDALNRYLGFEVDRGTEVPLPYRKVVRRKGYGDWRYWFTEEDVRLYRPAYAAYMETLGYDVDDWALDPAPVIDPEHSSRYLQSLPGRVTRPTWVRRLYRALESLRKRR